MKTTRSNRYVVQSVVHASEILSAFHTKGEVLRLKEVAQRTGFNKGMCFRFLYTLHECGFLEKIGENQYRLMSERRPIRRYRIGYASQGQDCSFTKEVLAGIVRAAEAASLELIVADNRYDAKAALRSADQLIHEKIDLAIEFQADEAVAPAIAAKYMEAGIPFIAVDIPHPGGAYFGANNYEAGMMAGRHLGRWAKKNWAGEVEEVLLLELTRSGSLPRLRMRGIASGLRESLRLSDRIPLLRLDGDGQFKTTLEVVRKHLRVSRSKKILVGAANDSSAARVRRSRPSVAMRRSRTECRTGGPRRNARAPQQVNWIGRLLSREIWGRSNPPGSGFTSAQASAAGVPHQTPARDSRECGSSLSE
jgi:ribose transport system substrate-binding protein